MSTSRREFLSRTALAAALASGVAPATFGQETAPAGGVLVNDQQSQLNQTRVARIERPASADEVAALLKQAAKEGKFVSVCGGRHAMGGQQFGKDTILIDTAKLNRVVKFDRARRLVTAEGGCNWTTLLNHLQMAQREEKEPLTIRQKQTGVDSVSLAGTLSANAHGRQLRMPPIVSDVEAFTLIDGRGEMHRCSRTENAELFSLAIGGYGLFGIISEVTLRLVPRHKVERIVKVIPIRDLMDSVEARIQEGFVFGDCQYNTDVASDDPHAGVFSCYQPVPDDRPLPEKPLRMSEEDWGKLLYLSHTDRQKSFQFYSDFYLRTTGQVYWSDTHQIGVNFGDYHARLDQALGAKARGTEMLTEVYVTADKLLDLLAACKQDVRERKMNLIYGTIRFIEADTDTFLPWAKERQVCIVCNLHIDHTPDGIAKAQGDFRALMGRAIDLGGRYFLTYQRWGTKEQVLKAYPQFVDFLKLKRKYDPDERIQSEWWRHYQAMFLG